MASSKKQPVAGGVSASGSKASRFQSRDFDWITPFLLFLVLRLFSSEPFYLLAGDQVTYLELGRRFPKHELFNHQLYLIHPPIFGYVIGLLHLFLPLLASGLVATLLFACVNFFVLRRIAKFENLGRVATVIGLMYLALNRAAVAYDYHVARVSILVCATALAILAFLRLLREPTRKTMIMAAVCNAFCLLISDQSLLLLPCEAVILLITRARLQRRSMGVLLAVSVLSAACWPIVRLVQFLTHDHLPAGIDGTIELTQSFPLLAVIQPNFLPFTNTHRSFFTETSLSLSNFQPRRFISLPTDLLMIPRNFSTGLVTVLVGAALIPRERRRRAFVWLILSLILLVPVGLGMYEWYGMGFIVPFSLLLAEGAGSLLTWIRSRVSTASRMLLPALATVCAILIAVWLTGKASAQYSLLQPHGGPNFLFARPPITRATDVSRFLSSMPATGIMAPVDLASEVLFLTDKRVVALPFEPDLLERFIKEYEISYLLVSSEFMQLYDSPVLDKYTSGLITRHIFDHPERYTMIRWVHEDYPAFYPALDYFVFKVIKRTATPGRPAL